jgi:hypothetical protein
MSKKLLLLGWKQLLGLRRRLGLDLVLQRLGRLAQVLRCLILHLLLLLLLVQALELLLLEQVVLLLLLQLC